jgi:hypothetical protein
VEDGLDVEITQGGEQLRLVEILGDFAADQVLELVRLVEVVDRDDLG